MKGSNTGVKGQNRGELGKGDGLEAPERRRDRGFGVIPATKRRRASMDIRGPGRFLIPPDLTAGVGRGYTPDSLDRKPSVGIGRVISKHPRHRGRSPDLRMRGSPPETGRA